MQEENAKNASKKKRERNTMLLSPVSGTPDPHTIRVYLATGISVLRRSFFPISLFSLHFIFYIHYIERNDDI
jgi:hypothetical protein